MSLRLLAAVLVCSGASGALAEPVSLAPTPHAGQSLRYEQWQTSRTTFGGQGAELNTRLRFALAFAPGQGAQSATMTLERIVVDLAQPGMRAFFDSEAPAGDEPNPIGPALAPLVGAQATMTIDERAQVEAVDVGANAGNQAAAMAGMSPRAVDEAVTRTLAIPDAPDSAEPGDRWTWIRRDTLRPGVVVSVAHDMLVESIEGDIVTVTFSGGATVEFDAPAAPGEQRPGLEDSEISGRIVWDASAGCAVSWDYLSSITMTAVNAQDPAQTALVRMERTLRLQRIDE